MDEINNQGSEGKNQNPYQGDNSNQSPDNGSYTQENQSTYWETGNIDQSSSQNPYSNNQQQMNTNMPYGYPMQQPFSEPPKKKTHRKLIITLAIIILIVGGAATAFASSEKLKNSIALMTKSPKNYYTHVEKGFIKDTTNKLRKKSETIDIKEQFAVDVSANLSFDNDMINSLMSTAGVDLSIDTLEDILGIPLDNIGFNVIAASNDDKVYSELGLALNNVDLITAEFLIDIIGKEIFARFPELSSAYLSLSLELEDLGSGIDLNGNKFDFECFSDISPNDIQKLLSRYGNIIAENIENVVLHKNSEVDLGNETIKCNVLTVELNYEDIQNIMTAILKEAKDDDFIIDEILPSLGINKSRYQETIDKLIKQQKTIYDAVTKDATLDDIFDATLDDTLDDSFTAVMDVYVDDAGEIIGREIEIFEDDTSEYSLGYYYLKGTNGDNYEFYIDDGSGENLINIMGTHNEKGGTSQGNVSFSLYDYFDYYGLDIEYKDVKTVTKNNRTFYYGTYTLSAPLHFLGAVEFDFNVKDNAQLCSVSFMYGHSKLVTLDISTELLDDFEIPSVGSEKIYDFAEADYYLAGIDIDKFLFELTTKLNIDLSRLMEYFMNY